MADRNRSSNQIKDAIDRFMQGRAGADQLSLMLLVLALVLAFVGFAFDLRLFAVLSVAALAYALVRMLSRDTAKRAREQREYLDMVGDANKRIRVAKLKWKNRKTTVYFTCKTCGTVLAVPRGKGKVRVTCPKCHTTEIHQA